MWNIPTSEGALVGRLTLEVIGAAADRRSGVGRGDGERPAPSLAALAVNLVPVDIGASAVRRAERRVPPALARYQVDDGRRLVVMAYASAVERLGVARGADMLAERVGGGGGPSDGGISARLQDRAFVDAVRGLVNHWRWHRGLGRFTEGPARPVLVPRRRAPGRRQILAVDLWDAVAIEGLPFAEILRRHGWTKQAAAGQILADDFAETVRHVADRCGHGARLDRA
ncbi:hypothetical protein PSM7751_03707 [Pseudooceanicola marinus]|uniref:Uncharacterized protein n=1 Tax=Pseudooceanicola marinus TaxID=396013 RepID=A0A1X7A4C8_9RHOB|nr:hypothetical protein [Pseudooceanicola marinus]PJE27141.1 hypothetical protein CVM50_17150 [Pseudooceanicola marinus]SLN70268.1 hypothetical protein PSM7751_03707 [Pseudooceanicola marinus]